MLVICVLKTFACKKCKKCFRKEAQEFEERYCYMGYKMPRTILTMYAAMNTVPIVIITLSSKQKHQSRLFR